MTTPFFETSETAVMDRFMADGHVVQPAEDLAALKRIRDRAAALAAAHLGLLAPDDAGAFLEAIHTHLAVADLNALRLAVIEGLNAEDWLRPAYHATARRTLEILVGNELAMQMRVNLSVQLPEDDSSLLPVHADVWNGDSPFEVVLWIPLVDCRATKSMFLLPPAANDRWQDRFVEFSDRSSEDLYQAIAPDLRFIDIRFGEIMVFSQNLMHGNRINRETETRWSMNCRFKALFTPYADKKLGEFFEPITLRPASRLGASYRLPETRR